VCLEEDLVIKGTLILDEQKFFNIKYNLTLYVKIIMISLAAQTFLTLATYSW